MKKYITKFFVAFFLLIILMSYNNILYGEIQDMGFEVDLSNWYTNGTVTLKTESVIPAGSNNIWTILPRYEQMAELVPTGNAGAFSDMANVLDLSTESRNYITGLFPNITNASYIYRDIELSAGEEFSMWWNYVSTDYEPFNDASLVTLVNKDYSSRPPIINGYYSEVCILGATVSGTGNYSTGSYGSTGWQLVEFKAIYSGTYRLGFAVYNLDDIAYNPYLFLDDGKGTTLKNGESFDPIPKDDNAPPPPQLTSLLFSNYSLEESLENDGSVVSKSQVTLFGDTFKGNIGELITEYEISNVPAGLSAEITKTSDNAAELILTGNATKHNEIDSIENLSISFKDGAFTNNSASAIIGADLSILNINFFDFENTIEFVQPEAKIYGDETFLLNAASDSNLPLIYTSSNQNVATVDVNGMVTVIGAGTTDITISDDGNEYYAPATDVTRSFVVSKKDALVTPNFKTKIYGEADPVLDGVLTGFLTKDNITASYNRTIGEAANTYTISAELNSSEVLDNYNIKYNSANFVVAKRPITVQAAADIKVYDGTVNSDKIPDICEGTLADDETAVFNQKFDDKNVGINKILIPTCKVYKLETETTSNYDITYISLPGEISLAEPIINLENKISIYTGSFIMIEPASVTGVPGETPSGNITYVYYTDRACTTLTTNSNSGASANGQPPVYAGIYYVKATIEKTLNYASQTTSAPGTLTILPAAGESLSLGSDITKTYGDESFVLNATGGSGTGTVTYTSSNPQAASVSTDGYVTINSAGESIITAAKASDGNYDTQYASVTLTVQKKPVTFIIANNNKVYNGAAQYADITSDVSVLKAGSDYAITYYKNDSVVESPVDPGVYGIVVSIVNNNYSGSAKGTMTISNAGQIDFGIGGIPQYVEYKDTFTVYPNGNINGITTFEIISGNATVNAATGFVTITGIGEVAIKATNIAENFDEQTAVTLFTVHPKAITVAATAFDRPYEAGNKNVEVELITNVEGLTAEYISAAMHTADAGVDKEVTVTGISFNNANYKPYSTTIYTTVTITSTSVSDDLVIEGLPSSITYGDEDFKLRGIAEGTGKVTWKSSDRTVAKVNSTTGVVTITGAGTAEITAYKESDGNYDAVSNSITIEVCKKEVTYSIINNTKTYNGSAQYAVVTASAISLNKDIDYKVTYKQNHNEVDEPTDAGVYDIFVETLNNNYTGYSSGATLTILASNQSSDLQIGGLPNYIEFEDSFALYANGGNGTGNVVWKVESGSQYAEVTSSSGIVSITGVGTVTVSATKQGDNNFNDQKEYVTFTSNKKQLSVTISNTLKTYNGYKQNVTFASSPTKYYSFEEVADIVYINQLNGENVTFRNVGVYNVLINIKEEFTEIYEFIGSYSAAAEIQKTNIIVKADDKSIYRSDNLPELTYSIAGLKGNDTIEDLEGSVSFECSYRKGSSAGEYEINMTGLYSNNYIIKFIPGTLTVMPATNSGGSGGSDDSDDSVFVPEDIIEQEITSTANIFDDVNENDWFYDAVSYVNNEGFMSGTSSSSFEPYLETTRSMIVTILYRLEGITAASDTSSFNDVPVGTWYSEAVAWATENEIVKGYNAETFGPNDNITREQLAAILYRYAEYKGYDTGKTTDLSTYADSGNISSWALESMNWAVAEGLITGTTTTTLSPNNTATRAQVAMILMRFIENTAK